MKMKTFVFRIDQLLFCLGCVFLIGVGLSWYLLCQQESSKEVERKVWHTKEYTLAIIKPDAVRNKHSGKIIDRIEQEGFDVIALEKRLLTVSQAQKLYAEHQARPFYPKLVEFMTSGPIVVMILSKSNAVRDWRSLIGATNPANAAEQTIRSLYGTDGTQNAAHGSDSLESATREVAFFFPHLISS